jgi:ribA/ribD-fused uncharacterized protein
MNLTSLKTYLAKNFSDYYFEIIDSTLVKNSDIKEILIYNNKHKHLGRLSYNIHITDKILVEMIEDFISSNRFRNKSDFNPDFVIYDIQETSEYYFLNNCYPISITYKGNMYTNAQSAYEAQKESNPIHRIKYTMVDGYTAMKISPEIKSTFENKKNSIMYDILSIKFSENNLKQKLLFTGDKEILYYNSWHDNYWGICDCDKCSNGQNNLGLLLMKLRKELNET